MNSPADQMASEIRQNGPMTLARFMALALYSPGCGYYETQQEIGQRGDFFTSVSVGSLFGELLAFQFALWSENWPRFSILEAGSHQGRLAADILGWLQRSRPDQFERVDYCLIEPSPIHRSWQRQALEPWLSRVRWIEGVEELPPRGVTGVIFANEFFDAMPMHRLGWDPSRLGWREWRVIEMDGKFSWRLGELSNEASRHLPKFPGQLAGVLPDQFTVEISPAAEAWWGRTAQSLQTGKLLTFDYGFTDDEWLCPQNRFGTLRGYAAHHVAADPLENPGGQDMTAHINFSALQAAGEAAGLQTDGLSRQEAFLIRIFEQTLAAPELFGEWTAERKRQFQTLTHPEHLGRKFRALAQSRVTDSSDQLPNC